MGAHWKRPRLQATAATAHANVLQKCFFMHANIYTVIALHKIQTNTIFLTLKFHDADLIAASLFCFFSIPSICTSHHWNVFFWDAHGWWEVITRDGNRISTPFVTLKHLISILKRYLIFITLAHISIVIVLFSHKLRMQMTKRAAICSQSMHRKSWGEKKTT